MSEATYNAISQGPATIPVDNWGAQQRITPPPQNWCNPRRTKIIIAIVILTLLWLLSMIVWVVTKVKVTTTLEELERAHYSSNYDR